MDGPIKRGSERNRKRVLNSGGWFCLPDYIYFNYLGSGGVIEAAPWLGPLRFAVMFY